ncbi:MAG: hypothetical protein V9H26_15485 [Verrucomicrobiota bacterium]
MKPIINLKTNRTQTQLKIRLAAAMAGFCLAFSAEAQTITWQENWESATPRRTIGIADNGYWEIGVPTYGPPDRGDGWQAHQGTNVAATVLNGDYTDDRQSRLSQFSHSGRSGQSEIPGCGFGIGGVSMWADFGQVQISTNNGAELDRRFRPGMGYGAPVNLSQRWEMGAGLAGLDAVCRQDGSVGIVFLLCIIMSGGE